MNGLQRFEQRLEQMISGVFARAFRSAVQPVEIAAALQRECDNNAQILSRERRLVPNDFHVELSRHRPRAARAATTTRWPRARRPAAGPRRRAGLRLHRAGQDRLRGGRRPDHRPVPDAQPRGGPGHRQRPRAPVPGPPAPSSRSTAPATRCEPPAWWSAAAPRPTCGSTTRASAAGTSSSGREHGDGPRRGRSTSARPTACSSTAPRSPRGDLHDGSDGPDRQHHDDGPRRSRRGADV